MKWTISWYFLKKDRARIGVPDLSLQILQIGVGDVIFQIIPG